MSNYDFDCSNIIKYQTNLKTHPNGCDMVDEAVLRNDTVLQAICSEEPTFEAGEKIAWIWPLIGLSVYLLDVTCRYLTTHSSSRKVATLQSHVLPGKGIYLRLRFTRTKRVPVGAGQYVLLQCPAISTLEWHPFTVIDVRLFDVILPITLAEIDSSLSSSQRRSTTRFRWRFPYAEIGRNGCTSWCRRGNATSTTTGWRSAVGGSTSSWMVRILRR